LPGRNSPAALRAPTASYLTNSYGTRCPSRGSRRTRPTATSRASDAELKVRTLTNLYNRRPTWLDLAHRKLDEAVFAAYGWPADLSDDEILARLLQLNLKRAKANHRLL
jgi:hypothetical protein